MNRKLFYFGMAFGMVAIMVLAFLKGVKDGMTMKYEKTSVVMGTALNMTVYAHDGEAIEQDIEELLNKTEEETISWRKSGSEVAKLNKEYNKDVPYEISSELGEYLSSAKGLYEKSDGLLDLTVRPLVDLWGIEDGKDTIPEKEDIDSAIKKVDMSTLSVDKNKITISKQDMQLDLGSIGKGIGCDKVYDYLKKSDAKGAVVSIGGSIVVYGSKDDGSNFKLGIRNPRGDSSDVMGIIEMANADNMMFMSTSGDYEKYFEKDGKRYHHILNPKTGYPSDTGTISATIICDNGLLSDGLSTIAMMMEREEAFALIKEYNAEAILIDEDRNVYLTDGIKNNFQLKDDSYKIAN